MRWAQPRSGGLLSRELGIHGHIRILMTGDDTAAVASVVLPGITTEHYDRVRELSAGSKSPGRKNLAPDMAGGR